MSRPLEGVRVLDFTWAQQGPYATVMLSDMGAEIIKIEPRRGDMGRNIVFSSGGIPAPAPYFVAHDRGKRSVTLDITTERGREIALQFAERVDVAVNNMRPGVLEKLRLGYEDMRRVNPRIVFASASAYGPLGPMAPLPGFDIVGQAAGGIMSKTGKEGDPPMPAGAAIGDQVGAIYLCAGILGGLVKASRTGEGTQVDISLYGTQIGLQSWEITNEAMLGAVSPRAGNGHPLITPHSAWGGYATSDGGIVLGGINGERFASLCGIMGVPELAEKFPTDAERATNMVTIRPVLQERFRQRSTADWLEEFRRMDVIAGPVQTYGDVIQDPQAWANGYLTETDHPALGRVKIVGAPIQYDREPTVPQGPPPELGDSTEMYLEELGYSWEEIERLRADEVI